MIVEIAGRIDRADIPALCERVRVALEASTADLVVCDVGALTDPDCVAVDALARLQLTVGRLGCRLRLRHVSPELHALLCFVGLSEVVGTAPGQASSRGGSPNSGKNVGVSRKKMIPSIRPSLMSRTWSDQGS
jgi:anti-anti-sigma regulatory factor